MDNCIFCHDSGKCHFCNGTGKSGSFNCTHCNGTGMCSHCHGGGSKRNQQDFGSKGRGVSPGKKGFGSGGSFGPGGGFGSEGGFGQQENAFDKAKRIVGEAITLIQSQNPMDRIRGMEMVNSHEAIHSAKTAYDTVKQVFYHETNESAKVQEIKYLVKYMDRKNDPHKMEILQKAIMDPSPKVAFPASQHLIKDREGAEIARRRIREIYNEHDFTAIKVAVMQTVRLAPKNAEPLMDIVVECVSSDKWFVRRSAKKTVKAFMAEGVNVVGHMMKMIETGTVDQKVGACQGLGNLKKDAAGSVDSLTKALNDESTAVRSKAAWALWKMGKNAAGAEDALREALDDESPAVNKYALKALKKMRKLSKAEKKEIKVLEKHEKELKKFAKQQGFKPIKPPKTEDEEDQQPAYKNKFFLSHSTKDFPWVQKLANVIESWPNCKAWYCERDIYHGQDWMESIYDGIEACNWYILVWSENAANSKWTIEEIREAKMRNIESENTMPKISLMNIGHPEMPRLLTRYQGSMVKSDADLQEFVTRLKGQVEF